MLGSYEGEKFTVTSNFPGYGCTISIEFIIALGSFTANDAAIVCFKIIIIALSIFSNLIRSGQTINIFEDGKESRDFVYIDDIVNANLYALENYDTLKGNWYEVGSGESNTFETIFDNLELLYTYHNQSEIPKGYQFQTLSLEKKWMAGWKPKFNLKKGLKEYKKYLNEKS